MLRKLCRAPIRDQVERSLYCGKGQVVERYAWGWANAERRIPFTPKTLFSHLFHHREVYVRPGAERLSQIRLSWMTMCALACSVSNKLAPGALHLCHNQSGLRDYWAVAMLHGALPERSFGEDEAAEIIGRARTLQFAPGTRYSYTNQNFRFLSDILRERTGRQLCRAAAHAVFLDRIGMDKALLAADTASCPTYRGPRRGHSRPRLSARREPHCLDGRDAGIAASLDEVIAWERHIDSTRDDGEALYRRLGAPVTFADGRPATYGFGLRRGFELGRLVTGHGGALRGWRSYRLYAPAERVSVVVMFNHLSDAHEAAVDLFAATLDEDRPVRPALRVPPSWLGAYSVPATELSARSGAVPAGVRWRCGHSAQTLGVRRNIAELERRGPAGVGC